MRRIGTYENLRITLSSRAALILKTNSIRRAGRERDGGGTKSVGRQCRAAIIRFNKVTGLNAGKYSLLKLHLKRKLHCARSNIRYRNVLCWTQASNRRVRKSQEGRRKLEHRLRPCIPFLYEAGLEHLRISRKRTGR